MEVVAVRFDPPEPLQAGDTLSKALERRFVQGFLFENTFGMPELYKENSTFPFSLSSANPTHEFWLYNQDEMTAIMYRRKVRGLRSHTLINYEGKALRRDNGIFRLSDEKEFGDTSQIGIAKRGSRRLDLEYYFYLNPKR